MVRNVSLQFILAMGKSMNIYAAPSESEKQYLERIILSAVSKWMLTAVYNGYPRVSVKSIRTKAGEKMEAYLNIIGYKDLDIQTFLDNIYDTLLENGMFFHEPDYVWPVPHRDIGFGDCSIVRGMLPEENVSFSGMAPFVVGDGTSNLSNDFMLWSKNGEETIRTAWNRSSLQSEKTEISEYLKLNPTEHSQYYSFKRNDQADITMGRAARNDTHGYNYFLIRNKEIRRMPDDYINASIHQYVRLAIVNQHNQRSVYAIISSNLVKIQIGYYLPVPDARLLRLISWPVSLQQFNETNFHAQMHPSLWPAMKERLRFLGYAVEEKHE